MPAVWGLASFEQTWCCSRLLFCGRTRTGSATLQRQCRWCAWCVATARLVLQTRPCCSPEFHEREIEVHYTGELVAVDTFFVGALKGAARCICKPCWTATGATLGDGSTQQAAGNLGSCAQRNGAAVLRRGTGLTILSDNGRECCGRHDHHPYKLILRLEGIEHQTTKVRMP